jgi:hypothetical protein
MYNRFGKVFVALQIVAILMVSLFFSCKQDSTNNEKRNAAGDSSERSETRDIRQERKAVSLYSAEDINTLTNEYAPREYVDLGKKILANKSAAAALETKMQSGSDMTTVRGGDGDANDVLSRQSQLENMYIECVKGLNDINRRLNEKEMDKKDYEAEKKKIYANFETVSKMSDIIGKFIEELSTTGKISTER